MSKFIAIMLPLLSLAGCQQTSESLSPQAPSPSISKAFLDGVSYPTESKVLKFDNSKVTVKYIELGAPVASKEEAYLAIEKAWQKWRNSHQNTVQPEINADLKTFKYGWYLETTSPEMAPVYLTCWKGNDSVWLAHVVEM